MVGSVAVHWRVTGSTAVQPTKSSGSPKLCDMMLPLYLSWETTAASALVMLVSKQSALATRTIFAPGASPCDMVTSSVVSSAQPTAPHSAAFGAVERSAIVFTGQSSDGEAVQVGGQRIVTFAEGMPNAWSNLSRSL